MKNLFPFLKSFSSSEEFDHYQQWLGIPKHEQPPTLYRLLGVSPYESDSDVIKMAAARQTAHVQNVASEERNEQVNALVLEINKAAQILADDSERDSYNKQLTGTVQKTDQAGEDSIDEQINSSNSLDKKLLDTLVDENVMLKEKSAKLIRLSQSYHHRLSEKEKQISNLKNELKALRAGNQEQEDLAKKIEDLEKQVARRNESVSKREKKIKALQKSLTAAESELESTSQKNVDLRSQIEKIESNHKNDQPKLDQYQKEIKALQADKSNFAKHNKKLEFEEALHSEEIDKLKSEIESLRTDLKSQTLEMEALRKAAVETPVAETPPDVNNSDSLFEAPATAVNPGKEAKKQIQKEQSQRVQPAENLPPNAKQSSDRPPSSLIDVAEEKADLSSLPSGSYGAAPDNCKVIFRIRDKKNVAVSYVEHTLQIGQEFRVGRVLDFCSDKSGKTPFAKDKQLSGKHFKLVLTENAITVTDVGSTNGTQVQGEVLKNESKTVELATIHDNMLFFKAGELFLYEIEVEYLEAELPVPAKKTPGKPIRERPENKPRIPVEGTDPKDDSRKGKNSSLAETGFVFDDEDSRQSGHSKDSLDWGDA